MEVLNIIRIPELDLLPKNHGFRTSTLNGKTYAVPRHFTRVDQDSLRADGGVSSTHGWQVRLPGTDRYKFFSDGFTGRAPGRPAREPNLELSLAEAIQCYVDPPPAELLKPRRTPIAAGSPPSPEIVRPGTPNRRTRLCDESRIPGVYVERELNADDWEEVYVDVYYPGLGDAKVRIFAGTCETCSDARLKEVFYRALELRREFRRQVDRIRKRAKREGADNVDTLVSEAAYASLREAQQEADEERQVFEVLSCPDD